MKLDISKKGKISPNPESFSCDPSEMTRKIEIMNYCASEYEIMIIKTTLGSNVDTVEKFSGGWIRTLLCPDCHDESLPKLWDCSSVLCLFWLSVELYTISQNSGGS